MGNALTPTWILWHPTDDQCSSKLGMKGFCFSVSLAFFSVILLVRPSVGDTFEFPKNIFAKCTRLACLLSFASLLYEELLWKNSTQETQTWRYLTLQIFTPRETLAAQLWRKASHFLWASLETGDSYCFVLILLILTSLLEPFWPDGTGCARGFLSALDAAWMLRSWSLQVIARR